MLVPRRLPICRRSVESRRVDIAPAGTVVPGSVDTVLISPAEINCHGRLDLMPVPGHLKQRIFQPVDVSFSDIRASIYWFNHLIFTPADSCKLDHRKLQSK